jgi:hypothetical protein
VIVVRIKAFVFLFHAHQSGLLSALTSLFLEGELFYDPQHLHKKSQKRGREGKCEHGTMMRSCVLAATKSYGNKSFDVVFMKM